MYTYVYVYVFDVGSYELRDFNDFVTLQPQVMVGIFFAMIGVGIETSYTHVIPITN